MAELNERAFQKQEVRGKKGRRNHYVKNVGLGFKTPRESHRRQLRIICTFVQKYQRYEKRHKNMSVHLSPCFRDVELGDIVTVGECRPLSKTVSFNVIIKVSKARAAALPKSRSHGIRAGEIRRRSGRRADLPDLRRGAGRSGTGAGLRAHLLHRLHRPVAAAEPHLPIDRQPLLSLHLKPAPRILRNLLSRLDVACDFQQLGCGARVKLASAAQHAAQCEYNPSRPVPCGSGCGLMVPSDQLAEHCCVRALRLLYAQASPALQKNSKIVSQLRCEQAELRQAVHDLRRQLLSARHLPPAPLPSRSALPSAAGDASMAGDESLQLAWARSLRLARVARWGGVISTPDLVLQAVVRRSLAETGCPSQQQYKSLATLLLYKTSATRRLLTELMDRAHERGWPDGVASLEQRQTNRRQYDSYVIRRVPGKQAVLLLACENRHMPPSLMLEPGIVMIFAHGVE
uniref:Small ribosomal subunit protein uS17 n=1 Tax=Macrostomum lignano TaxID=282301 RepID=A0A1I8F4E9_9PLAT